jgi:hypothetical protein
LWLLVVEYILEVVQRMFGRRRQLIAIRFFSVTERRGRRYRCHKMREGIRVLSVSTR